jgi:RNA-directed DNA polymerase
MTCPVSVLVDNDDGGKKLFGPAKDHGAIPEISLASTAPFYFLGANLYIVKTPEMGADHKSCMEDLFDASIKAAEIDGKIFDPAKDHDAPGKYGKFYFAEKVVKPNAATIDFSMFAPLLERIVAVLADYKARMIASAAA